jgi:hypothetical protein
MMDKQRGVEHFDLSYLGLTCLGAVMIARANVTTYVNSAAPFRLCRAESLAGHCPSIPPCT